jgi:hypothetical protein
MISDGRSLRRRNVPSSKGQIDIVRNLMFICLLEAEVDVSVSDHQKTYLFERQPGRATSSAPRRNDPSDRRHLMVGADNVTSALAGSPPLKRLPKPFWWDTVRVADYTGANWKVNSCSFGAT